METVACMVVVCCLVHALCSTIERSAIRIADSIRGLDDEA